MTSPPTKLSVAGATTDVLAELEEAFRDIPFENSAFQTKAFVIAAQLTPARAYRAIGLRMFDRIRALKENEFESRKIDVDLQELREKLTHWRTSKFDKMRAEIEIERIESRRNGVDKLKGDALRELELLYSEFKKLPKYTRAQFEAEEAAHFELRLARQVACKGNGALEAQMNMTIDMNDMPARIAHSLSELQRIGLLEATNAPEED